MFVYSTVCIVTTTVGRMTLVVPQQIKSGIRAEGKHRIDQVFIAFKRIIPGE